MTSHEKKISFLPCNKLFPCLKKIGDEKPTIKYGINFTVSKLNKSCFSVKLSDLIGR